jgi:hypothetical protein
MSKSNNTLGIIRILSSKYVQIKNNLKETKVNLNDSGSLINDKGNMK